MKHLGLIIFLLIVEFVVVKQHSKKEMEFLDKENIELHAKNNDCEWSFQAKKDLCEREITDIKSKWLTAAADYNACVQALNINAKHFTKEMCQQECGCSFTLYPN